jgi:hypothetical protein
VAVGLGTPTPRKCLATEFRIASSTFSELVGGHHGYRWRPSWMTDPYMQERQWGSREAQHPEPEVACATGSSWKRRHQLPAVHRFPFSYCEEFLGNGVTYRHKYYLVRLGPTRPTRAVRPRNPRRDQRCPCWMTYEDVLNKLKNSATRGGPAQRQRGSQAAPGSWHPKPRMTFRPFTQP